MSRFDRTTLVAGTGKLERTKLVGAIDAESELKSILYGFFGHLSYGANPRPAIRLTMGTGKSKQMVVLLGAMLP